MRGWGVPSRGRRGVTDLDLIMAALIQLIFEAAGLLLRLSAIVATVDGFFIRPVGGRRRRG